MQKFKKIVDGYIKLKPTQQIEDACLVYTMTGAQLLTLDGKFEHPTFQINCDRAKVDNLVQDYIQYPQFFNIKNKFTFAVLSYMNKLHLMDGQHRFEMLKQLGDKLNTHHSFDVLFYNIKDDDDHILLFKQLNYDSYKNREFVSQGASQSKLICQVAEYLNNKYHFSTKREYSEMDRLYTIKAFISKITPYIITFSNVNDVIQDMDIKLSFFKNQIKFECYKEEQVSYPDSMLAITRVNFTEYLMQGSQPNVIPMNKHTSMTPKLKKQVWEKEYGDELTGKCPITSCATILSKVGDSGWHGGHIISRYNGGKGTLVNLRPICATCNSRMRESNWI